MFRGLAQDLSSAASHAGVDIVIAADFTSGKTARIEQAVASLAASRARVIVCAMYNDDLAAITEAADRLGLLQKGYSWILASESGIAEAVAASPDPQRTQSRLTGWLTAGFDYFEDENGPRFQLMLENDLTEDLSKYGLEEGLEPQVKQAIDSGPCDQYCRTIYDAVWTAAIAIRRVGVGHDGAVDKRALLSAIRNVSFWGATGRVALDRESGEREATAMPLLLKNLRPVERRSGTALAAVLTWTWVEGDGGGGVLQAISTSPPIWPGRGSTWAVPLDSVECDGGYVFDNATVSCVGCAKGTAKDQDRCVRCAPGETKLLQHDVLLLCPSTMVY